ncbi:MAG: hypothetical protein ACM3QS_17570, partial [Bacteroidota bacterium]
MRLHRSVRIPGLVLSLLLSMVLLPAPARADSMDISHIPATPLMRFARSVFTGESRVTGVYVPSHFSFPVVAQPDDDFTYVSTRQNTLTQFELAAEYHNIGLLAHNYLAGRDFFDLTIGEPLYLIYGGGRVETFQVTQILQYQALDPENPYSDFRDLVSGITLTATEMFTRVYTGAYHVTFQTCIQRGSDPSWGRIFVIAEPVAPPTRTALRSPGQGMLPGGWDDRLGDHKYPPPARIAASLDAGLEGDMIGPRIDPREHLGRRQGDAA